MSKSLAIHRPSKRTTFVLLVVASIALAISKTLGRS